MANGKRSSTHRTGNKNRRTLRSGFSTGTAATAAARAALRFLLTRPQGAPEVIAVRLAAGYYLPVPILECTADDGGAAAIVVKDGGDDPDVTDGAELWVRVRMRGHACGMDVRPAHPNGGRGSGGICLVAGRGVGVATKPGLPVRVGEPAINPVPREMLVRNLTEEILWRQGANPQAIETVVGTQCMPRAGRSPVHGQTTGTPPSGPEDMETWSPPDAPHVFLPFSTGPGLPKGLVVEVQIEVPKGETLARRTLNPRLGVAGGISILGTTGLVKPFSHKAYEETIDVALSVAASSGCEEVVLSTGGKSEHFARALLPRLPAEAFVQIADFFAYSVRRAREMGFKGIVHSAFFGKVVKMAQGHAYTHAHEVPLDLNPLANLAREKGTYDQAFCDALAAANTARHALELLLSRGGADVMEAVGRQAVERSFHIAGGRLPVRLLLFDYDGTLLADLEAND